MTGNLSPRAVLLAAFVTAALAAASAVGAAGGVAVDGHDGTRILAPSGARVEDYANAGYRLWRRGEEVHVEVTAAPLGSTSPFRPPRGDARDPLRRLAGAQTSGAATRYAAVDRILGWVSRHVEYRLERREPQDAAAVLERRSAYCTGLARLSVALLHAVGVEAREVAGYVVDDGSARGGRGYHRWIEVYFPDRGWVFSDPLTSHHYVPATYVRFASDALETEGGLDGLLLERTDAVVPVDLHPAGAPGVQARRNSPRRLAAALRVWVEDGPSAGEAELEGTARRYRRPLAGGGVTFVGLEPGPYRLLLRVPGRGTYRHDVELPDRRAAQLRLRLGASMSAVPAPN